MRRGLLLVVVLIGALAWRAVGAADAQPGPATRPAVLVMAFMPLGDVGPSNWMGQGIQQNLLSELGRVKGIRAVAPPARSEAMFDAGSARKIGGEMGASYAIVGSFQIGEFGLRITGNVLDVQSGTFVSGLKATGSVRDLFLMEDSIAEQAKRILTQQIEGPRPIEPATAPAAVDPAPEPYRTFDYTYMPAGAYNNSDYRRGQYNYIYGAGVPFYYGCGPYPYGYYYGGYRYGW